MTKKMMSIIMGILLLVSPLVLAQTDEQVAGMTPDDPFWGIDVAMERIRMMFTLNKEDKVSFGLQIAEERLAEIQLMANQNKIQSMNKAEVERGNIINEVERNAAGLSQQHRLQISERLQNHIQMLEQVREKVSEQAQLGLDTAIDKSSQVLERMRLRMDRDLVCCKIYGLGAYMEQVNIHYELIEGSECSIPEGFVGGGREIVDNSYCK